MWLWLITGLVLYVRGQSPVIHENYGVIFLEEGLIEPVHEVWHHTFAINVSRPDIPDYEIPCRNGTASRGKRDVQVVSGRRCMFDGTCNDTSLLDRLCPSITENKKRHDFLRRSVLDLFNELDHLLPDADHSRKKRGLFDFVGIVYKSLFGVATVRDTRVLRKHIRHVRDSTSQIDSKINVFGSDFESYIKLQSKHDELIQQAIETNNKYINLTILQIMKQTVKMEIVVADAINYLHLMNLHYTSVLDDIRSDLRLKLNGIHTLMRGFLPPELVPVDVLVNALQVIRQELANSTHMSLTHENHLFYYHIRDVTYTRDNDILFVKITIPLTTSADIFKLFRLHTIPVILASNRSEYTQIDVSDKYLALSVNEKYYTILSDSEYISCKGVQYMRCDGIMRMKPISNPSCMLGLFKGNSTAIAKLCTTYIVTELHDTVVTIRAGKYFVSSGDEKWQLICRGKQPRTIPACQHCRISVPCGCALRGSQIYIPETVIGCDPADTPTMVHSTNLPALFEFYKQSKDALNISSRKSFASPLAVKFPKIDVISHDFEDVVQKLEKSKLSLKAVAANTKENREMFLTPTSKLRADVGLGANRHFDFGIMILSTAGTVIATVALWMSLRNARVILLAKSAVAFDFLASTQSPTKGSTLNIDQDWQDLLQTFVYLFTTILVFGLVIAIMMFARRLHRYYTSQPGFLLPIHTALYVAFYAKGNYVSKKLGTYSGSVANLQVLQTNAFKMPRIIPSLPCLKYNIKMDWTFLEIKHKPINDKITLPTDLRFPMISGGKTREIMQDPEAMILFGEYGHAYYEIYAWYKGSDSQLHPEPYTAMTVTPQHIYPTVPYAPSLEERADAPV